MALSDLPAGFFTKWQFDAKRSDSRDPLLEAQQVTWVYRQALSTAVAASLDLHRTDEGSVVLARSYRLKDVEGRADNEIGETFPALAVNGPYLEVSFLDGSCGQARLEAGQLATATRLAALEQALAGPAARLWRWGPLLLVAALVLLRYKKQLRSALGF